MTFPQMEKMIEIFVNQVHLWLLATLVILAVFHTPVTAAMSHALLIRTDTCNPCP